MKKNRARVTSTPDQGIDSWQLLPLPFLHKHASHVDATYNTQSTRTMYRVMLRICLCV